MSADGFKYLWLLYQMYPIHFKPNPNLCRVQGYQRRMGSYKEMEMMRQEDGFQEAGGERPGPDRQVKGSRS